MIKKKIPLLKVSSRLVAIHIRAEYTPRKTSITWLISNMKLMSLLFLIFKFITSYPQIHYFQAFPHQSGIFQISMVAYCQIHGILQLGSLLPCQIAVYQFTFIVGLFASEQFVPLLLHGSHPSLCHTR